jgi:hypothetical protein
MNTSIRPGLYKLSFRGLTIAEAWRFGGEPFKFIIALILKAFAFKGPLCHLPSYYAEKECDRSVIPSQDHFKFLQDVDLAMKLGYREGRFYTQSWRYDPEAIDGFSYIGLHDDMRRSLFIGSVRRKGGDGIVHNVVCSGALHCLDSDDVGFMNHQFHFDSPPPSRKIKIKETGVIAIDQAMQNFMETHDTIKFSGFLGLREHIKFIADRAESSRIKRGLFIYEKEA